MISLVPLAFAFLPCAAADEAAVARLRLQVELPPVPAYPADGVIPEELWKRFVFLDEEAGELILSFPPDSDEENPLRAKRSAGRGSRQERRSQSGYVLR